ncbi:MAG: hypothetical protein PHP45_03485 [Elusimicrobiales bacterium]|nr:hypothetical protein [Elusimicrobiales bacterium]
MTKTVLIQIAFWHVEVPEKTAAVICAVALMVMFAIIIGIFQNGFEEGHDGH